MKSVTQIFALASVGALFLVGCSSAESQSQGGQTGGPESGGELIVGISGFPVCLDIAQHPFQAIVHNQTVETLVDLNAETLEVEPWLAESVTPNADASEYTISLRDDVTFSNGEKLTAELVKKNLENVIALGEQGKSSQGAAYLGGYKDSVVQSENELTVSFEESNAGFPQALSQRPLGVIASESLDKTPEDRCNNGVIGTSPWVIDSVAQNESVAFVSRDDYNWPSPNAEHEGRAHLDKLTFQVIPEGSVRTGSLQSGAINVLVSPNDQDLSVLESAGNTVIKTIPGGHVNTLALNVNQPNLFEDESVRKAIQLGVDRAEIQQNNKAYNIPRSIITSTTPGFVDLTDDLKRDVESASELLEQAGWELNDSDNVRYKDGQPLVVETNISDQIQPIGDSLEIIQKNLAEVGIRFEIKKDTNAAWSDRYQGGAGDWNSFPTSLGQPNQNVLITVFHPDHSITFQNPETDPELVELLEKQNATADEAERNEIVEQIQKRVIDKAYTIPLLETTGTIVTTPDAQNVKFLPGHSTPIFYDAWVSNQ